MEIKRLFPFEIEEDYNAWKNILNKQGLRTEKTVDLTLAVIDDNSGQVIGTGSLIDNLIKMVSVDSAFQGEGTFNFLMSQLLNEIYQRGYSSAYVYTKPCMAEKFNYLGFKTLVSCENKIVFMERSILGIESQIKLWQEQTEGLTAPRAAIVMNANPFTLGHQYLVEQASMNEESVIVFVVSQERSLFSFRDRFEMVKLGTQHLKNVVVVPTGPYMVSTATFPSYFLDESAEVSKVQASIDAKLFSTVIAPALNITKRYLGTEPNSQVTSLYNEALSKQMVDIDTIILLRKENKDGVISATKVRELILDESTTCYETLEYLVPDTTLKYLKKLYETKENKR